MQINSYDILSLMGKQNGLAPILMVLLIALVVGGILIYQKQFKSTSIPQSSSNPVTSSSAETANWKTYKDNKINFEVKYSSSWARI